MLAAVTARRVSTGAGVLTIAIAAIHTAVGVSERDWPSFDALWFHGTGMGLFLAGALTLLAASARAWPALIALAVVANALGLGLATVFGILSDWSQPQGPVLMAVFAVGGISTLLHSRLRIREES